MLLDVKSVEIIVCFELMGCFFIGIFYRGFVFVYVGILIVFFGYWFGFSFILLEDLRGGFLLLWVF